MKNIPKIKFAVLAIVLLTTSFWLLPVMVYGEAVSANVSFEVTKVVHLGDTFEVVIEADTNGVLINSVNFSFDYDESLVSFAGYKDENTVVNIWINAPHEENGIVQMSGIIPGGVSGLYNPAKSGVSPLPVARLLFRANGIGEAKFKFLNTQILKHDGRGTELAHEQKNSVLEIDKIVTSSNSNDATDKKPPEAFTISFLPSSLFSRTPDMIIFESRDVDSGIKEYQMKIGVGGWKNAKSPEALSKSIFSRNVSIRAYDFAGNSQEANIVIPGIVPFKVFSIILVLLVLSGILGLKLLKYKS